MFDQKTEQVQKKKRGCAFYGFILMLILSVVVPIFIFRQLNNMAYEYTETSPVELPEVNASEEETLLVRQKVGLFIQKIENDETPAPLVVTARELNVLVTQNEELRDKLYLTISDGKVKGQLSIPMKNMRKSNDFQKIPQILRDQLPNLANRYFNAEASFNVYLKNGVFIITLDTLSVKDEPLPDWLVSKFREENLAHRLYKDPEKAKILQKFKDLEITEEAIVLTPQD